MSDLGLPDAKDLGTRFSIVGFLPPLTTVLIVLGVLWAGAPTHSPELGRLTRTATALTGGEWTALALGVLVLVFVTNPLELRLVRLLEGYSGGAVLRPLMRRLNDRQLARWQANVYISEDQERPLAERRHAQDVLRHSFPVKKERLLPTELGNVLRAAEDRAGQYYGWSTIVAWPRLYMLLPDRVASLVADARNQLDLTCRYTVSFALAGVIAFALMAPTGPWCLLAFVPAVVSWISYRAAVDAARSYGVVIQTVFDLYRLELLKAMHLALPPDAEQELKISVAVSRWFSQGIPHQFSYDTGDGHDVGSDGAGAA